jgi:hypothetical protein
MLNVWRKTLMPHQNKRRKTLQTKKATAFICILVACRKTPLPHKERKQKASNF